MRTWPHFSREPRGGGTAASRKAGPGAGCAHRAAGSSRRGGAVARGRQGGTGGTGGVFLRNPCLSRWGGGGVPNPERETGAGLDGKNEKKLHLKRGFNTHSRLGLGGKSFRTIRTQSHQDFGPSALRQIQRHEFWGQAQKHSVHGIAVSPLQGTGTAVCPIGTSICNLGSQS